MRSQDEPLENRACTHRSVLRHSMAGRFSLPQPKHWVRLCCHYTEKLPRPKAGGVSYLRKVRRIQVLGARTCKRSVRHYTAFPVTLRDTAGRIKDRRVCLRQRQRRSLGYACILPHLLHALYAPIESPSPVHGLDGGFAGSHASHFARRDTGNRFR